MPAPIQIVSIGNAYELLHPQSCALSSLSELARIDEQHFGQKAALWQTPFGLPSIVVCTRRQFERTLQGLFPEGSPVFIEPQRRSSSICEDLLGDPVALRELIGALDPRRAVYLAPYIHTAQVESLARSLRAAGFKLVCFRDQADLVSSLCRKDFVENRLFRNSEVLRSHRPHSSLVGSYEDLRLVLLDLHRAGIQDAVVKSVRAVGGAGVFFVSTLAALETLPLEAVLIARGQNEPDRRPPFLVEECVPGHTSPTVDIYVGDDGHVSLVGVALQRLYDRRYYIGFCTSPQIPKQWWYDTVVSLSLLIGNGLADLGFLGPANVDFVVSAGRVTLIELNPRRSALIDGLTLAALRNGSWYGAPVSVADYISASRVHAFDDLHPLMCERTASRTSMAVMADGGFDSRFHWLSAWVSCPTSEQCEAALESLVECVGGLHSRRQEREDIGRVFSRIALSQAA